MISDKFKINYKLIFNNPFYPPTYKNNIGNLKHVDDNFVILLKCNYFKNKYYWICMIFDADITKIIYQKKDKSYKKIEDVLKEKNYI